MSGNAAKYSRHPELTGSRHVPVGLGLVHDVSASIPLLPGCAGVASLIENLEDEGSLLFATSRSKNCSL